MTSLLDLLGERDRITVRSREVPQDIHSRTLSYPSMRIVGRGQEAYNRRDWRELNRLGVVWWDQYALRWHKFTQYFWDA